MERIKSESEILRDKREELFKKNIFLIVANEERILSDKRLGCVRVPTFSSTRYLGAIHSCTLRNYLRIWRIFPGTAFMSSVRVQDVYYIHKYYRDIPWSAEEPYTLEEAIEILKRETDEETYAKNIERYMQQWAKCDAKAAFIHLDENRDFG